jgi:hypothetical protein
MLRSSQATPENRLGFQAASHHQSSLDLIPDLDLIPGLAAGHLNSHYVDNVVP